MTHEGELVLAGGWDDSAENLDGDIPCARKKEVYVYDGRRNAWMEWPSMAEGRQRHGLISLDAQLFAVGGTGNSSIEVFDGTRWEVVNKYDLSNCERACRI